MNPRSMSVPVGPKPPPRGEDLPYDDGEPMETSRHREQMLLLITSLADEWAERDDVCVEGNMALYFSETQARRNDFRAPDVFVVLGAKKRERKSWVVWEEDGRTPDLVIELVSESTEHVDRGVKMDVYAKLVHVPIYVIYDPFSARLDVYALDAEREYRPLAPDARGYYWCARVGLFVGVVPGTHMGIEAPWLRWIRKDGTIVPTAQERAALTHSFAAGMRDLAEREAKRADEEAKRADEEAKRADEEARRADEEARRAAAAEARAALLEAELAKLRGSE